MFYSLCLAMLGDFNNRNQFLTKLFKQGYRFHKLRKAFSKFYHIFPVLLVKYSNGFKIFYNKAYWSRYCKMI